jgi:Fe-S cluster assembly protein SufD
MPVDLSAAVRIVFVNGRFSSALSSEPPSHTKAKAKAKDVEIAPLAEVLRSHPDWLQPHLARIAAVDKSAFTAWNTAFFEGGAFVRIARGSTVKEPIHVVFLSEADSEPSVSHPRVLVVAEPGAHASIVERYIGEGRYLTDAVTEIFVGDDASIEHSKIQRESVAACHVHTIAARIGRAGRFESMNVALGGALARTDIDVLFAGEGGECTLNGLFVASGAQHLDNHTFIDHATPHCSSRELYKGILDGKSRGVFHGTILVRKDAQKTDAMQTNKNLLLSRDALVNSTPALEIFADDVKCKHGSTIGQLDAGQLFYLRSRGIGEAEARTLLTWAFAEDVARRIRVPEIRAGVEAALGLILPGAEGMEGAAS